MRYCLKTTRTWDWFAVGLNHIKINIRTFFSAEFKGGRASDTVWDTIYHGYTSKLLFLDGNTKEDDGLVFFVNERSLLKFYDIQRGFIPMKDDALVDCFIATNIKRHDWIVLVTTWSVHSTNSNTIGNFCIEQKRWLKRTVDCLSAFLRLRSI